MRSAKYGWIVDVDRLAEDGRSDVGRFGPRNTHMGIWARLVGTASDFKRWRCKDADGEIYYEGRYIGPEDNNLFGPLEDFATPNAGAIDIAYFNPQTQAWEAL